MQIFQRIYEGIMLLLDMVTIITLWLDHSSNSYVNWIVWFIFFVDFCFRFLKRSDKWGFIKQNPFLVIAIIPIDQFFQIARFIRMMYLFRMKTITKFYIEPIMIKISYQSKLSILFVVLAFLFIESLILWYVEESVRTLVEAYYYVLLHLFFFGQRIIEVENIVSLFIFVSTTIIGVLLHGIALQWFFTKVDYYYKRYKKSRKDEYGQQEQFNKQLTKKKVKKVVENKNSSGIPLD